MIRTFAALAALGLMALAGVLAMDDQAAKPVPAPPVCPGPNCPVPTPEPWPEPKPKPAPRPWGDPSFAPVGAMVGGRVAPDGTPIQIDFPPDQHMENVGGSDGMGLCVMTSVEHAANWHDERVLLGFQQWMRKRPGGGTPRKLDRMIAAYCKERNLPIPPYMNVEALDLELIAKLTQTGHLVCSTYSRSPSGRYGGQRIAHMLNTLHGDLKANGGRGLWGVMDNNFPGSVEWMTTDEYKKTDPSWIVAFLRHGPPPPPRLPS